jgi:hypothetical protein
MFFLIYASLQSPAEKRPPSDNKICRLVYFSTDKKAAKDANGKIAMVLDR